MKYQLRDLSLEQCQQILVDIIAELKDIDAVDMTTFEAQLFRRIAVNTQPIYEKGD